MPPKGRKKKTASASDSPIEAEAVYSSTIYDALKADLSAALQDLCDDLAAYRAQHGTARSDLPEAVANILKQNPGPSEETSLGKDNRVQILDGILQTLVLDISQRPHVDYDLIQDMLDVTLCCEEQGALQDVPIAAINSLVALIEKETVEGADILFAYTESRKDRLMLGLEPRKHKALLILKMCNDLLRRLSRSTHTVFCGRIIMFLSSVFPIGDQSSVNLRGTYDADNITIMQDPDYGSAAAPTTESEEKTMEVDQPEEGEQTPAKVEETGKEADDYTLFWSLQRLFSFPPNLIKAEPILPELNIPKSKAPVLSREVKSSKDTAPTDLPNLRFLRYAGNAMLDLFTEANRKEKDLAGAGRSSTAIANQRAVDSMSVEEVKEHYFFPKFLTSRTLFDLEVADSSFRRQIIIQLIVTLLYLRGYTPGDRARVARLQEDKTVLANKQVLPAFTLPDEEIKWLYELNARAHVVLRGTSPDGERFTQTVVLIATRDQHWINWKMTSCKDFALPPLTQPEASEEAKKRKKALLRKQAPLPHALGNPALSNVWARGGDDPLNVDDLKNFQLPQGIDYFKEQLENEVQIQKNRKSSLTGDNEPTQGTLQGDKEWAAAEDRKNSLVWRILRLMPAEDTAHFKMSKGGDMAQLLKEVEANKKAALAPKKEAAKLSESTSTPGTPKLPEAKEASKGGPAQDVDMTPAVKSVDASAGTSEVKEVKPEENTTEQGSAQQVDDKDVQAVIETPLSAGKRERTTDEDAVMEEAEAREAKRAKTEEA